MKKYILSAIAIATALFAGCARQEMESPVLVDSNFVKVTAALDATKITSSADNTKYLWAEGDVIGVWTGAEFTPFTIEASSVGTGVGVFAGTLPEGGAINENSIAVYPYNAPDAEAEHAVDAYDGSSLTINYNDDNWNYKSAVPMYAKATATASGNTVADFKFCLLTAAAKLTIKNIPAEAKCIFLEAPQKILFGTGTADLTADYPKATQSVGAFDYAFINLPEHTGAIKEFTFYIPICCGEYADPKLRFTLFSCSTGDDFTWSQAAANGGIGEMDKATYNHNGFLNTGGYINRGDLFVLPEVNFGPAEFVYEPAFNVWNESSVATLERTDDMALTVLKTAKFYADAEDLYVYMEIENAKQYGPTADFNLMMDFYIDCDGNPATGGIRSDMFNHGVNWYYETFVADANQIGAWDSGQYEYNGADGGSIWSLTNHGGEFPVETAGFYDAENDFAYIEAKLSRTDFKLVNTKAAFGIAILDGTDGWDAMGKLPQNADLSMFVMDLPAYAGAAEPVEIALTADMITTNDPMQYVAVAKNCNEYGLGGSPDWFYNIEEDVAALRKAKYGLAENMFDDDPSTCFHTNTDWGAPVSSWGQREYSINNDQWTRRRIEVSLPEAKNAVKIWFQTSDSGNKAASFIIATSTNGTDFTDYGEAFGDGTFGAEYTVEVAVDGMKAFRILNTKGDASWTYCDSAFGIAELKVWENQ